jgi:hypothetical protein
MRLTLLGGAWASGLTRRGTPTQGGGIRIRLGGMRPTLRPLRLVVLMGNGQISTGRKRRTGMLWRL